jgi:hypothetical protein
MGGFFMFDDKFLDRLIHEADKYDWDGEYPHMCMFGFYFEIGKRLNGWDKSPHGMEAYYKHNKVIGIESAFFGRDPKNENWQIGSRVKRVMYGNPCVRDEARLPLSGEEGPERLEKFGVEFSGKRNKGEKIIIPLQCPFDASVEEYRPYLWAARIVFKLRKVYGYNNPIELVIHPGVIYQKDLHLDDPVAFEYLIETTKLVNDVTITQRLNFENALFTVVLRSGAAIESVLAGVPVFSERGCFIEGFSDLSRPEWNPEKIYKNLIELSWLQWDYAEIPELVERLYVHR